MQVRGNLGVVSGTGELPIVVAGEAKRLGYRVVAVALENLADGSLGGHVDEIGTFNAGRVGDIIKYLRKNGVTDVVMAGKVPKSLLFQGGIKPDLRAMKLLFKLRDKRDDTIMLAAAAEFEREGMRLLETTEFCAPLITPKGALTKRKPARAERKDIEFGLMMAREMGRLDIGQTVVVKDRAVMAVEAIEGTDEAIRRGGRLASGGAVVVKTSKPGQDMRFDVPTVGMGTLDAMIESGCAVLAVEAGKSIFLNREALLARASENDIAVYGVPPA